jgi:hypothetical protein
MVYSLFLLSLQEAVKAKDDWRFGLGRHVLDLDGLADIAIADHARVARH